MVAGVPSPARLTERAAVESRCRLGSTSPSPPALPGRRRRSACLSRDSRAPVCAISSANCTGWACLAAAAAAAARALSSGIHLDAFLPPLATAIRSACCCLRGEPTRRRIARLGAALHGGTLSFPRSLARCDSAPPPPPPQPACWLPD